MNKWLLIVLCLLLSGCACCADPSGNLPDHYIRGASLVQPGQQYVYEIVTEICCPPQPSRVNGEVVWTIEPEISAVKLDGDKGLLSVVDELPSGYEGRLTARVVGEGRSSMVIRSRADDPLSGTWHQTHFIDCEDGSFRPDGAIGELKLGKNDFSLTWQLFESYVDFWGALEYDSHAESIRFQVLGGNRTPVTRTFEGNYEVDSAGRLVLHGVHFENPHHSALACGHVFSLSGYDAGFPIGE